MDKNLLSQYYAEHHREGKKFGFIFGGNERGRLFAEWIGTGKNVLM